MCWLRAITTFQQFSFFLPQGWKGTQDKRSSLLLLLLRFSGGYSCYSGWSCTHVHCRYPAHTSPSAFHTPLSKVTIDCHVKCLWMGSRTFLHCLLTSNLAIAMDQLRQLMRAFGKSWEFSGIQCKLNISLDICRILYVLTKPLQFWCLSVSLT